MAPPNRFVFINCPFDEAHYSLLKAASFTCLCCNFVPRCALEETDSGTPRLLRLYDIIEGCDHGLHDLSCTELSPATSLPRFNMPFELGLFLGAKQFGDRDQQRKRVLVVDCEPYRYQKFLSDISGCDLQVHAGKPETLIGLVREWLQPAVSHLLPGPARIHRLYSEFCVDLPSLCGWIGLEAASISFNDYACCARLWLEGMERLQRPPA